MCVTICGPFSMLFWLLNIKFPRKINNNNCSVYHANYELLSTCKELFKKMIGCSSIVCYLRSFADKILADFQP